MYCCDNMENHSIFDCENCVDEWECPDTLIGRFVGHEWKNSFGIIIHDGGTSMSIIEYCPWCGVNLNRFYEANKGAE